MNDTSAEKFQQMIERTPITRLRSDEPNEGYYWDALWQTYMESDALLRERVKKMWVVQAVGI
jgi:hypothetical protein